MIFHFTILVPPSRTKANKFKFVNIWLKWYRKLDCSAVCASDQPISAKGELMVEVFNFQKVSDSSCCVKTFHSVCSNNRKHSTTPLLFPKDGERDMVSHMKWRKLLHSRLCSVGYDLHNQLCSCLGIFCHYEKFRMQNAARNLSLDIFPQPMHCTGRQIWAFSLKSRWPTFFPK